MSGLTQAQKDEAQKLIDSFVGSGGQVVRGPRHAPSTGSIRYNFAAKAKKERDGNG